jgi:hypothetical protein
VDECERQADGQRGQRLRRPPVGGAEDDDEEPGGQHQLGDERRGQVEAAGGVLAVAVGGEAALGDAEAGLPGGDQVQRRRRRDRGEHLSRDVRGDEAALDPATDPQPDRHGGVEVSARGVPERVGHREDRQAEGERDAEQSDADVLDARGEDGGAAPPEDEPERADELGGEAVAQGHDSSSGRGDAATLSGGDAARLTRKG